MKILRLLFALSIAGTLCQPSHPATAQTAPSDFFYHDGDRILLVGDSITHQQMYSTLVESYVLSRFPQWNVTFRNVGIPGDTMGLKKRRGITAGFARDFAPLQPTAVTIAYGMNDARSGLAGEPIYRKNAGLLSDKFHSIGTRVAFVTSSPVEDYKAGQPAGSAQNTMLRLYSATLQEVATEKGDVFVDQLNPMIAAIETGRLSGVLGKTSAGPRLTKDGMHPLWGGHLIMANAILKGLKAPSSVSKVTLDAYNGNATTENAAVTGVHLDDRVTFTRTDKALPWPIPSDPSIALALKIPGVTPYADLSRFELQVNHLLEPAYEVTVDGTSLGTFSREALAAGVNLSDVPTGPIYTQGQALLLKIQEKNALYYHLWYEVQLAPLPLEEGAEEQRAAELAALDRQIAAAETEINVLRQPKPHVWSLTPVAVSPLPLSQAPTSKISAHWQGDDIRDTDGKYLTNQPITIRAEFSDADGLADLKSGFILLGNNQVQTNAFLVRYNREDGSLSLRNDADDGWVGTGKLGSPVSLANSQGRLLLEYATVQSDAFGAVLTFQFIPFDGLAGLREVRTRAADTAVTKDWGSPTILRLYKWGQLRPIVKQVRHTDAFGVTGTYPVGAPVNFTAEFGDDNGIVDLKSYVLTIGATSTLGRGFTLRFDPQTRLLFLLDDTGKIWLGGYPLESANVLENSRGQVNLINTWLTGNSTRLKLNFTLTPKPAFAGSYRIWAEAKDMANKTSGVQDKGPIAFVTAAALKIQQKSIEDF